MRAEDNYPNTIVLQHLVDALEALVNGDVGLTVGVRNVVRWRSATHGLADADELFQAFVGVDSETDAFPIGEVRQLLAKDALARFDTERERSEAFYRGWVLENATRLLAEVREAQLRSRFTEVPR